MKIGDVLGHYRIDERIGAGAMGEVYRAHDSRLGRDVAIKVLPESLAADPGRLSRFRREARALAALNHPNIASIHGLEQDGGALFLVLELVLGTDLSQMIPSGGLPLDRALDLARQAALGLEAAHTAGILHRDLKPSNVRVTPTGQLKILDFGLAKNLIVDQLDASASTLTALKTESGILVGSPAYMSPEQARGLATDKRADIWALGCILYEMITGRRAFAGPTATDVLARVLTADPDWSALPPRLSPAVTRLLQRCLQKDPQLRTRDMGDVVLDLGEIQGGDSSVGEPVPAAVSPRRRGVRRALQILPLIVVAIVGALVGGRLLGHKDRTPAIRLDVSMPAEVTLIADEGGGFDLDPAGERLVFVGEKDGIRQLYMRRLDQLIPRPIGGTEGASCPFFSPDGSRVGFFAGGKLKTASLLDAFVLTLCEAGRGYGACWTPEDTLIFASGPTSCLQAVPAIGGSPREISRHDNEASLTGHRSPALLPGTDQVLFVVWNDWAYAKPNVVALSRRTGRHQVLIENAASPKYLPSGHLLFLRDGVVMAVPFDRRHLRVTGNTVPVIEGAHESGIADLALSGRGAVAYVREVATPERWYWERKDLLVWVDRKGRVTPTGAPPGAYILPALSPDGRKLAVTIFEREGCNNLWVMDVERGTMSPLVHGSNNHVAVWTPDGKKIALASDRDGQSSLYLEPLDRSLPARRLIEGPYHMDPISFSPDGRWLTYWDNPPETGQDIWLYSFVGDGSAKPLLVTPFNESHAAFSPNGRLLVYSSDESGRPEVYIQPFPGPGERVQVSVQGGTEPVWGPRGDEIIFWSVPDTSLMVAGVSIGPEVDVSIPRTLFTGRFRQHNAGVPNYAISPDGSRFVMVQPQQESRQAFPLTVVLDWRREFEERIATSSR